MSTLKPVFSIAIVAASVIGLSQPLTIAQPTPTSFTLAQSPQNPTQAVINAVAQPNLPTPTVEKLTLQEPYGLATWLMGEAGGMVALVNRNGGWQVIRLGGGLPNAAEISRRSGMPTGIAQQLLTQHLAVPFASVLPQLKRQTRVPIYLPSVLPTTETMYYRIVAASTTMYSIDVNYTADCRGTPCNFAYISAEKGGRLSSARLIPEETVKAITLGNNTPGLFRNACGAYCTASVEWQTQGVLYRVSIKNGQEVDVVGMANSAIATGRR